MKVTVSGPVTHLCPYKDEADAGSVDLTFDVAEGDAPELHELAASLQWAHNLEISHEQFTRDTLSLSGASRIVTRWTTAGLDVTCELSSE